MENTIQRRCSWFSVWLSFCFLLWSLFASSVWADSTSSSQELQDSKDTSVNVYVPKNFPTFGKQAGFELISDLVVSLSPRSSLSASQLKDTYKIFPLYPADGCSFSGVAVRSVYDQAASIVIINTKDNDVLNYTNWIAFAPPGNCSVEEKAAVAANFGATALIIGVSSDNYINSTSSSSLTIPVMYGDDLFFRRVFDDFVNRTLNISNVVDTNLSDVTLNGTILIYQNLTLYLTFPPTGPSPWLLTLIITVVLLCASLVTSVVMHCYLYRRRRRAALMAAMTRTTRQKRTLTKAELEMLPTRVFRSNKLESSGNTSGRVPESSGDNAGPSTSITPNEDGAVKSPETASPGMITLTQDPPSNPLNEEEGDVCAICLEPYRNGDILRDLRPFCTHYFHSECIDEWFTEQACYCPTCKQEMFPPANGETGEPNISHSTHPDEELGGLPENTSEHPSRPPEPDSEVQANAVASNISISVFDSSSRLEPQGEYEMHDIPLRTLGDPSCTVSTSEIVVNENTNLASQ